MLRLLPTFLALFLASEAPAVIIDSGDGSGNTTAPSPDPGWSHVGIRGGATAVYLRNGWVITANHVGPGDVVLGGVTYSAVAGSEVEIQNGGGAVADLELFAITPVPPLDPLPISSSPPANGAPIILVGNGRNRGSSISCNPMGSSPIGGYDWASGRTLRWGTNFVEDFTTVTAGLFTTEAFGSFFDEGGSDHEAQAATGDSGGAVFAWNGSGWELAGAMIAISIHPECQDAGSGGDPSSSLYGQATYAADLSYYRDPILDVIALPEPQGGLAAGFALLAALARRRRRSRP